MNLRDWSHWIDPAIMILIYSYLMNLWNRHSVETRNVPERRTVYDFLHTYPIALYGLGVLVGMVIDYLAAHRV